MMGNDFVVTRLSGRTVSTELLSIPKMNVKLMNIKK
jgi:hypothetical protein